MSKTKDSKLISPKRQYSAKELAKKAKKTLKPATTARNTKPGMKGKRYKF